MVRRIDGKLNKLNKLKLENGRRGNPAPTKNSKVYA
jgi:hypothetical protein